MDYDTPLENTSNKNLFIWKIKPVQDNNISLPSEVFKPTKSYKFPMIGYAKGPGNITVRKRLSFWRHMNLKIYSAPKTFAYKKIKSVVNCNISHTNENQWLVFSLQIFIDISIYRTIKKWGNVLPLLISISYIFYFNSISYECLLLLIKTSNKHFLSLILFCLFLIHCHVS